MQVSSSSFLLGHITFICFFQLVFLHLLILYHITTQLMILFGEILQFFARSLFVDIMQFSSFLIFCLTKIP
jgi:hypothetical protein